MSELLNDPLSYLHSLIFFFPALIVGFSFHEYAHARAAVWLGDDTPRLMGRLTLSPFAHVDLVGLIVMVLFRFGWAKPVVINPRRFMKPRRDDIIVSLAGVTMNLLLCVASYLIVVFLYSFCPSAPEWLTQLLEALFSVNATLCVFNLLPVPPLDGSRLLRQAIGPAGGRVFALLDQGGIVLLLLLSFTGVLGRVVGFFTDMLISLCRILYTPAIYLAGWVLGLT